MVTNSLTTTSKVQEDWHQSVHNAYKNACTLPESEEPDRLWMVNMLVRSVTKWNKACDKRLTRLISYINETTNHYRQYCYVGDFTQECKLGSFRDVFFCRRWARFQSNLKRSALLIWITNICSHILDVQEANSCVSPAVPNQK